MALIINKMDFDVLVIEYLLQHKGCNGQRGKDRVLEKLRYNYKKLLAEKGLSSTTKCVVKVHSDYCDIIAEVVA
jgi:hypothetical protein